MSSTCFKPDGSSSGRRLYIQIWLSVFYMHENSEIIERVTQFAYLGTIINDTGGTEADTTARMWKAQIAFSARNKIWHSAAYSTQTKFRIFNTNMKAVLLYGCETWKNSRSITAKLQVFINKCLRKILRILWPDQITNKELWKCTKQPRIDMWIRKRKWGRLGHTLWKPPNIIARQALEWNPQGKRDRRRPRNTWQRTVLEEAEGVNKTWTEIKTDAKNRVRGGFLWKPCVPQRNDGMLIYVYMHRYKQSTYKTAYTDACKTCYTVTVSTTVFPKMNPPVRNM
jgi:hypothetical protein